MLFILIILKHKWINCLHTNQMDRWRFSKRCLSSNGHSIFRESILDISIRSLWFCYKSRNVKSFVLWPFWRYSNFVWISVQRNGNNNYYHNHFWTNFRNLNWSGIHEYFVWKIQSLGLGQYCVSFVEGLQVGYILFNV